jgi:hypothetical protein
MVYATLVLTTLWLGLRTVFIDTPWRTTYLAVYSAFVGAAAESVLIDSDHWRHYFLLLGVIWGLMAASRAWRAADAAAWRTADRAVRRPGVAGAASARA